MGTNQGEGGVRPRLVVSEEHLGTPESRALDTEEKIQAFVERHEESTAEKLARNRVAREACIVAARSHRFD